MHLSCPVKQLILLSFLSSFPFKKVRTELETRMNRSFEDYKKEIRRVVKELMEGAS